MVTKAGIRARLNVIKSVLSQKSYFLLFFLFLAAYFAINFLVNQFEEVIPFFLSFNLLFVVPYFTLTALIGIAVALSLTIIVYKLRQVLSMRMNETGLTAAGFIGGILGGACPGCFVGLFPALAGVFGVTVTLSSLPFLGFEVQVPAFLVSLAALYIVSNPLTCAPKGKPK